ncbi:MAG: fliE [Phycisphaerales bacterium]|nr:fliE [Phycisphaerales bacterium]
MINGIDSNIAAKLGAGAPVKATAAPVGDSFADVLKGQINEVSKLQQDASQAVENLATGRSDDVAGVMTAMEKSDMAFKTLLAIRAKLMDAYDEIKNISV